MTMGATVCFFLLLSITVPGLHAYGHGSHPKCTTMPASEVYHGTCYFQYEIGRGYVRKTCPSGTLYSQQECGCVHVTQRRTSGRSTNSLEVEATDDYDDIDDARRGFLGDKSTFHQNLFTGGPLSILKYLFTGGDEYRNNDDFFENDDRERNDGNRHGFDDFDNFLFYGDGSDGQEFAPRSFWDNDRDFGFSRTSQARGKSVYGSGDDDERDDADGGNDAFDADDLGQRSGQTSTEYSNSGVEDQELDNANPQNRRSNLFDKLAAKGYITSGNTAGASDNTGAEDQEIDNASPQNRRSNLFDRLAAKGYITSGNTAGASDSTYSNTADEEDDDFDDKKYENDSDRESDKDDVNGLLRHGYHSIYSAKGLLNPQKQYRYEDLFVNLLNDDDDDNKDEQESDDDTLENYQNIYEEKIDGVLEYVDDLFNDIFDDDFDSFYRDIFDDDGYDDCFVKKYAHYFDGDFENELGQRYNDFDEFFKNHSKIKSLLTRLINDDTDADDDNDNDEGIGRDFSGEDSQYQISKNTILQGQGNMGTSSMDRDDDTDDQDENGWPGSANLKSFAAIMGNRKRSKPRDSRLFDFSRMLRQNQNQPRNVFDVFYQGSSKH